MLAAGWALESSTLDALAATSVGDSHQLGAALPRLTIDKSQLNHALLNRRGRKGSARYNLFLFSCIHSTPLPVYVSSIRRIPIRIQRHVLLNFIQVRLASRKVLLRDVLVYNRHQRVYIDRKVLEFLALD